MTATSRELLVAGAPVSIEAAEQLMAKRGSPLVNGTKVTFLFKGDVRAVYLHHFVYGLETSQPFQRMPGSDIWWIVLDLPRESRIEYKFVVEDGGRRVMIRDPLNPNLAYDPFGANSVCHGDGYATPAWTLPDPESREGRIVEHTIPSSAYGSERRVLAYLPARMRASRGYPMLVVFDGEDYLRYARLQTVLDNLIHNDEIAPMIVALTQSPDRTREYAANPATPRFVFEDIIPFFSSRYPVRKDMRQHGIMGASLGAVAALHAAWLHPEGVGKLLLQSGSFAFTDIGNDVRSPVFEPIVDFMNPFRADPGHPAERVFVSCGTYERLIYENRSLIPLLQRTDMDVRFVEARDGHNWENWRDRLREGLAWLFPGPLGLVYE